MTFKDWLTQLLADQHGRIWWRKLEFDVEAGNLESARSEEFQQEVEARLPSELAPLALAQRVLADPQTNFDLRGRRVPQEKCTYSRVIDADTFAAYHVAWEVTGEPLNEQTGAHLWEGLGKHITSDHYDLTREFRTLRGFFWCTTVEELKKLMVGTNAADRVRDALGLLGVNAGTRLLRVDVPTPDEHPVLAPTALDQAVNTAFMPCADADGRGWTLHLRTLERGVSEVIVKKIKLTRDFLVARIGEVTTPCPSLNLDRIEKMVEEMLARLRTKP